MCDRGSQSMGEATVMKWRKRVIAAVIAVGVLACGEYTPPPDNTPQTCIDPKTGKEVKCEGTVQAP